MIRRAHPSNIPIPLSLGDSFMSDIVLVKNLGALIDVKSILAPDYAWTAGGGSDSITFTSTSVDREGLPTGSLPRSADVDVYYAATLGSGHTLSLYLEVDSAPDNSTWTAFATEASVVIATGPSGGGAVSGVYRMTVQSTADNPVPGPGISLQSAQRYLRVLGVPHLSATGTDTAQIQAVGLILGGFDQHPAPAT
jgi:hypothetical protein